MSSLVSVPPVFDAALSSPSAAELPLLQSPALSFAISTPAAVESFFMCPSQCQICPPVGIRAFSALVSALVSAAPPALPLWTVTADQVRQNMISALLPRNRLLFPPSFFPPAPITFLASPDPSREHGPYIGIERSPYTLRLFVPQVKAVELNITKIRSQRDVDKCRQELDKVGPRTANPRSGRCDTRMRLPFG